MSVGRRQGEGGVEGAFLGPPSSQDGFCRGQKSTKRKTKKKPRNKPKRKHTKPNPNKPTNGVILGAGTGGGTPVGGGTALGRTTYKLAGMRNNTIRSAAKKRAGTG